MLRATVRRYRALRGIVRVVSVVAGPRRRSFAEALLRAAFGDTVEAQGHLLAIERGDRPLGERLRRRGVWSRAETALCGRLLRRGDTVVDGGAHIGYFTTLFARHVGPGGSVLAFEPEPRNRQLLQDNVDRNGYGNVSVVGSALSREQGRAVLSLATINLGDHRLGRELPGRISLTVPTTTLDAELAAAGRLPAFIKLDLQGSEPAAFDGGRQTLERCGEVALVTEFCPAAISEAGDEPLAYLERIAACGFTINTLEPTERLKPVATEMDRTELAGDPATDVNLLCWKGRSPLDRS